MSQCDRYSSRFLCELFESEAQSILQELDEVEEKLRHLQRRKKLLQQLNTQLEKTHANIHDILEDYIDTRIVGKIFEQHLIDGKPLDSDEVTAATSPSSVPPYSGESEIWASLQAFSVKDLPHLDTPTDGNDEPVLPHIEEPTTPCFPFPSFEQAPKVHSMRTSLPVTTKSKLILHKNNSYEFWTKCKTPISKQEVLITEGNWTVLWKSSSLPVPQDNQGYLPTAEIDLDMLLKKACVHLQGSGDAWDEMGDASSYEHNQILSIHKLLHSEYWKLVDSSDEEEYDEASR